MHSQPELTGSITPLTKVLLYVLGIFKNSTTSPITEYRDNFKFRRGTSSCQAIIDVKYISVLPLFMK